MIQITLTLFLIELVAALIVMLAGGSPVAMLLMANIGSWCLVAYRKWRKPAYKTIAHFNMGELVLKRGQSVEIDLGGSFTHFDADNTVIQEGHTPNLALPQPEEGDEEQGDDHDRNNND